MGNMRTLEKKRRKYKHLLSAKEIKETKKVHPCSSCYYEELTLDLENLTANRKCRLNLTPTDDCVWSDPKGKNINIQ